MRDGYFLKCSLQNGDTIFTRSIGGPKDDEFFSLTESVFPGFQGFVLCGYNRSFSGVEEDQESYTVKIDSIGAYMWMDSHGHATGDDINYSSTELNPLHFFISGTTPYGGGGIDVGCGLINWGGFWLYNNSTTFCYK